MLLSLCLALAPVTVRAQVSLPPSEPDTWLDRTQQGLHRFVWRTARSIDSWAGPPHDEEVYQEASGSVGLAVLWDEFDGFDIKSRFRLGMPLPQINRRLHLFVGRVNRDEYVTERDLPSGAFPRWRSGVTEEDQTLAGLIYSRPERRGVTFSASLGGRVRSSALDPYIKTSVRYRRVLWDDTLFTAKETLFYQLSERFGLTTRMDFERMLGEFWRLRWTGSATVSEGTDGIRGYTSVTATRAFLDRRAIVLRVGVEGNTAVEVPVRDYGVEVAYRQTISRDWLVLELRTSLMWPKDLLTESRAPSWGFGIGCEMFFGPDARDEFTTKPVTF